MAKTYIIIHHTAVSREKNNNQFDAVKRYHQGKGWGDIGYHYLIEPDGTIKEGRSEKSVGAHCKEEWMNWRSIGICLTGHFDIEDPTDIQLEQLANLVKRLREKYKIKANAVKPHRAYAKYKSCPGVRITDQMIEQIADGTLKTGEDKPSAWAKQAWKNGLKKGVLSDKSKPRAYITKEELMVFLDRLNLLK